MQPTTTSSPRPEAGAEVSVGLGLYLAREIANAHGGRVEVPSSEEEGTTCCVHWPRA